MEVINSQVKVDKERMEYAPHSKAHIKRILINGLAEELAKSECINYEESDDDLEEFYQMRVRANVVVASKQEMKQFEEMKEFIEENNLTGKFNRFVFKNKLKGLMKSE